MDNTVATIYCSSSLCQAPNPENHRFCQKCRTPLPKRYLWVVNPGRIQLTPGQLLQDRYYVKEQQVLLDTKSAIEPEIPTKIVPNVEAYLHLSALHPHVPAAYTCIPVEAASSSGLLLLLEEAPLRIEALKQDSDQKGVTSPNPSQVEIAVKVMPALTDVWQQATAFRQLNWLWQIAQLWQPLKAERAAASLLNASLLRVEGSLLRLLELQIEDKQAPAETSATLAQLGQCWLQWVPSARPSIRQFLETLCQQLIHADIQVAEQLMTQLDRGLEVCARSQNRQLSIANYTDQGPSRQRNEDACYPANGSHVVRPPGLDTLTIVCDGIGGHEGGSVASNLAIEAVKQHVQKTLKASDSRADASNIIAQLNQSVLTANDALSKRNDSEQREGRKRMGTTLVMALACDREIYITHVGDSRAYLILPTNCHQITLDDDVASREARLGYAFYREVVQRPAAGSLVQALGMSHSRMLHPTVQRFLLDEDCIYLLCSDGLSDNDRVEQYWETEILPLLEGQRDPVQVGQRLIELANTRNGHDNVTVSVIHCQTRRSSANEPVLSPELLSIIPPLGMLTSEGSIDIESDPEEPPAPAPPVAKTQVVPSSQTPEHRRSLPLILLLSLLIFVGAGALAYWLIPEFSALLGLGPNGTPEASPATEASPPSRSSIPLQSLNVGTLVQVQLAPGTSPETSRILLKQKPDSSDNAAAGQPLGFLESGSVVKVLKSQQGADEQDAWVEILLCTVPTSGANEGLSPGETAPEVTSSPQGVSSSPTTQSSNDSTANGNEPRTLQTGAIGWVRASDMVAFPAPAASSATCN